MIQRAHTEGAEAIVVMCDLWSIFDNGQGRKEIPGDVSWVKYDAFVDNIIAKSQALGPALQSTLFEIWNEPQRGFFWRGHDQAAYDQYLAMWSRGVKRLRKGLPGSKIVGPSIWGGADPDSAVGNISAPLFNQWLDETKANDTFPDVLSWHVLADSFAGDYNPSPKWEVKTDDTEYTIHHTPYIICTIHHTPYTIHRTPYTIHHAPYSIHHTSFTPYTIHHTSSAPCTVHPTPCGIQNTSSTPYTKHHTAYTIHHTPYTIRHTPRTIHHAPYTNTPCTIHNTPYTIHHTPYTIHHTPYTIHHAPYTMHHIPYATRHTPHATIIHLYHHY
jgi:hypothetical protein